MLDWVFDRVADVRAEDRREKLGWRDYGQRED